MAGLSLSGSHLRLAFVVLLGCAVSVANCTVSIFNSSPVYVSIFDATTPGAAVAIYPNENATNAWAALPDGTVPDSRMMFFMYYTSPPNTTANATLISGNKNIVAMTNVYDKASITFFEPADSSLGRVGLTISYEGSTASAAQTLAGVKNLRTAAMTALNTEVMTVLDSAMGSAL